MYTFQHDMLFLWTSIKFKFSENVKAYWHKSWDEVEGALECDKSTSKEIYCFLSSFIYNGKYLCWTILCIWMRLSLSTYASIFFLNNSLLYFTFVVLIIVLSLSDALYQTVFSTHMLTNNVFNDIMNLLHDSVSIDHI